MYQVSKLILMSIIGLYYSLLSTKAELNYGHQNIHQPKLKLQNQKILKTKSTICSVMMNLKKLNKNQNQRNKLKLLNQNLSQNQY